MIDTLKPLIKQFLPFAQERMGFEHPPRLFVRQDADNAANPLGKTAYYDPGASSVTLYVTDRHPKDVMRSLSHELVHHTQHCNGELENAGEMGEGYAQNNPHMREMERQAYEIGNLCFRDWEDSIKGTIYNEHLQKGVEKNMSTKDWKNGELNSLLLEKWGFKFDLDRLDEKHGDYTHQGGPGGILEPGEEEQDEPTARLRGGNLEEEEELEEKKAGKDWHAAGDDKGQMGAKDKDEDYGSPRKGEKITTSGSKKRGSKKGDEAYVNEDCPMSHGDEAEVMVVGDEGPEEAPAPEERAVELVDELRALLMQLTGGGEMMDDEDPMEEGAIGKKVGGALGSYAAGKLSGGSDIAAAVGEKAGSYLGDKLTGDDEEDEEEPVEEKRARGRRGPHTRGVPDPRVRGLKEAQVRQLVRTALKRVMEKKNG